VVCNIHHPDGGTALFDILHSQREAIEKEFGAPLEWAALPDKKRSWIRSTTPGTWQSPESEWPTIQGNLVDLAYRLDKVLRPRIQAISP